MKREGVTTAESSSSGFLHHADGASEGEEREGRQYSDENDGCDKLMAEAKRFARICGPVIKDLTPEKFFGQIYYANAKQREKDRVS